MNSQTCFSTKITSPAVTNDWTVYNRLYTILMKMLSDVGLTLAVTVAGRLASQLTATEASTEEV
jgi:hypothetical protein